MPKKTAENTYFNFIAEMHTLVDFVQLSPEECTQLGLPPNSVQIVPNQAAIEKWIFQKYLVYNRTFSPFKILQSISNQLDFHARATNSVHHSYRVPVQQIFYDLFPHLLPNAPKLIRPKRKWCPNCKVIKSTEEFIPVSRNVDRFSKFCRKCDLTRERGKTTPKQYRQQAEPAPQITLPPVSAEQNADDLDLPDHSQLIGDL